MQVAAGQSRARCLGDDHREALRRRRGGGGSINVVRRRTGEGRAPDGEVAAGDEPIGGASGRLVGRAGSHCLGLTTLGGYWAVADRSPRRAGGLGELSGRHRQRDRLIGHRHLQKLIRGNWENQAIEVVAGSAVEGGDPDREGATGDEGIARGGRRRAGTYRDTAGSYRV